MGYQIINQDVVEWARDYSGPKFHALLCDPPYHLTSITKRFGKNGSAPAKFGKDGAFSRASAGFMNQTWDGGDIAFRPETWAALGQHLYPGAFGFAFASSRGWHRMAVAIEDAGFIIHPSIFMLGYSYGSGFPKATRIDTQVDKAAGVEREVTGIRDVGPDITGDNFHRDNGQRRMAQITAPATDLAKTWASHRYGLQALKPALEPIIVFQRPYEGRPVDNITQTGAGALNIDAGRIGPPTDTRRSKGHNPNSKSAFPHSDDNWIPHLQYAGQSEMGRWPSNLLLHHLPTCQPGQCSEGCPVERLGEMSGECKPAGSKTGNEPSSKTDNIYGKFDHNNAFQAYGDGGTAARYFFQGDWHHEILEQLHSADPVYYTAKASRTEREAGLDNLPTKTRHRVSAGGLENEPRFAPTQVKNNHPTVKSISLTKYLASLLLPPGAYAPRRILIPFAGVGSEMIGAMLAGWDEVTGIEKYPIPGKPVGRENPDYIGIARARLSWWSQWLGWGQTDVDTILASVSKEKPVEQMKLF